MCCVLGHLILSPLRNWSGGSCLHTQLGGESPFAEQKVEEEGQYRQGPRDAYVRGSLLGSHEELNSGSDNVSS